MSLEEVARRARVSTATVSRVLNGVDVVRSSTRARVMKAMSELKYYPNLHARSLAGGRSRTLGVIVSNLSNPFFLDVYRAVESDCHAHGYEVLVANTDYRPEQLAASIRLMIGRRVAGLAAIVSEIDDEIVRELTESNIPIVFYDVGAPGGNITRIRVNYRKGIERIVEYLITLGHQELGFIGHHAVLGPIDERRRALFDTIKMLCPQANVRVVADSDSLEGGRQGVAELLASGQQPTAIICVNDLMAVGALRELRERGILVPEEISVTGFDNIQLSEFCYPALTTVHIPRDQIGHTVFMSLAPDAGEAHKSRREFLINPELMVRDSTGPVRRK
ncbi:MAG TPA: LacI family DNA-binding transcriptional regulator [Bryobacteraceae bacterium]|nr:LacI family DNA-binding transcriptional regulator [Bryobacteraceae bacterium]